MIYQVKHLLYEIKKISNIFFKLLHFDKPKKDVGYIEI